MKRRGLIHRLYGYYLGIIAVALSITALFASHTLKHFHHEQVYRDLIAMANILEQEVGVLVESKASYIDTYAKAIGNKSGARLTVILPSGKVAADSNENPASMDNHGDRPEVIRALSGETGRSIRHSFTLKTDLLYVAIPMIIDGRIVGVLRLSEPLNFVDKTLNTIYLQFAIGGLAMSAFAIFVGYFVSIRLSKPLHYLREGAEHFAAGDFKYRLPMGDSEEISTLADSMNRMAVKLDDTIQTLVRQRNFLDAILTGMIEGVIAVDRDENVVSVNKAARDLLGIESSDKIRSIQETIRNSDIQRFVRRTLSSAEPTEGEISINGDKGILLHAQGAALRDISGKNIGAVVVLDNITRMRRLETVRRDFVANVSHELRTPITSIKGFVETLMNGAIKNPEEAERFIGIVAKQADRLNAILEDLLSLSRIEQDAEKNDIPMEESAICPSLESAIQLSEIRAREKNIEIKLECDPAITATISRHLIEQAVVNLLDNAIKYSDPGKEVKIVVAETLRELTISVIDQGCGIEKEHLPRLFERFYRVDKARSRKLGGTGLGLAIVKHIANAHKGRVEVESAPGKGSSFSIRLPKK